MQIRNVTILINILYLYICFLETVYIEVMARIGLDHGKLRLKELLSIAPTMDGSNYWGYGYKTQHSYPRSR